MTFRFLTRLFAPCLPLFWLACQGTLISINTQDSQQNTPDISGTPTEESQEIYETEDMGSLCVYEDCVPPYETLPDTYKTLYSSDSPDVCAFDYDPNQSSQFLITKEPEGVNGLKLLLSKEDLFFLAWATMRYQINPHFLLGIMAQESYGNCAAVSYADAEGCFQITNYYGRLQLQQSFAQRVLSWHWNNNPDGYYPDSIFINPLTWFGEDPETDQFRTTLDPGSTSVLGIDVSSVVNFNFGVIGSTLYYHWEQHFLYYNYSSLRPLVLDLVESDPDNKSSLMAAAYNGGIGSLTNALNSSEENYLSNMAAETQDYVTRILYYCKEFQNGSSYYTATYNSDEIEYIIDLLALTYDTELGIDWEGLKQDLLEDFFTDQEEISFTDDAKALIYFISTYDPVLAPVWAEDVFN